MSSVKGMTVNAWSAEAYNSSDFDQSLANLASIKANWALFTIFWFMNTSTDTEIHPRPDKYTASDSSVVHAIQKAHELGLKVALKPMVDVADGTWRGLILPSNWTLWFINYRDFTNHYANLSTENNVELFVVGTELRSSQSLTSEWRQVINEARARFSGNLTYAANWDSYGTSNVRFWDALDYVGVDAYFPLTNSNTPSLEQLTNAWSYSTTAGHTGRNWTNDLYSTYTQTAKKIVFTEIGYYSQDGVNTQPWTGFEPPHQIDLQEQADCYQVALEVFRGKNWFMGWFWWDWQTDPNAGGSSDNWYTPQNKQAQNVLSQYYSLQTITFKTAAINYPVVVNFTCDGDSKTLTIPPSGSNSISIPYGSTISYNYSSLVEDGGGIRYVLTGTNPVSPIDNVINDMNVIGNYKTQYYLSVNSAHGSPTPTSIWFDAGTFVTASVVSPWPDSNEVRFLCKGWTGTGSVPTLGSTSRIDFTINASSSITWNWQTQFLLTIQTEPNGLSPEPARNPGGDENPGFGWWYNASVSVALTAQTVSGYTFSNWSVDDSSQGEGTNPITINMNTPHTAVAHFTAIYMHDIAITSIALSKRIVGQNYGLNITITATNHGYYEETLNITVYANDAIVGSIAPMILPGGALTDIVFTWNTSGFAKGSYTLTAKAEPVPFETDLTDNNLTSSTIFVHIPGDVNGDCKVDVKDVYAVGRAYGSYPGHPMWNTVCDINNDGKVDVKDYYAVCRNFGQTEN